LFREALPPTNPEKNMLFNDGVIWRDTHRHTDTHTHTRRETDRERHRERQVENKIKGKRSIIVAIVVVTTEELQSVEG
jgi:hypothetical protein